VKKFLTRDELNGLLVNDTYFLVWFTALVFATAGSFWSHFALGPISMSAAVLVPWFLCHAFVFLGIKYPSVDKVALAGSFLCFQTYFWALSSYHRLPVISSAPIFFLVCMVTLSAMSQGQLWKTIAFWAAAWISVASWLNLWSVPSGIASMAFMFGIFASSVMIFSFYLLKSYFSKRINKHLKLLGPTNRFENQRIHASKLQVLGELSASLSHEMLNPLAAINGYSYQIKEEIKEKKPSMELITESNDRIAFNVGRIIEITRVLKGFSRSDSGDTFKHERICVRKVIEDSVLLVRHSVRSSGVDLRVELPPDDIYVHGSLVELSQVIVNFITNARDAVLDRSEKRVTIGCEYASDHEVDIYVDDSGPGVPSDVQSEVFKPFFTTKGAEAGTGLGLYISKLIADRHKALVSFETSRDMSGQTQGSRFFIRLKALNSKEIAA
jgi:signal transduction histidine kinase